MSERRILYVSVDVETDGPLPGVNSLLSLGAAAFELPSRTPLATFEINFKRLSGAVQDKSTMDWWETQPEAWLHATQEAVDCQTASLAYFDWITKLSKDHGNARIVMVGYPASFDFQFSHWYLVKFAGSDPMGFSALDIKTLAADRLGLPYNEATKRNMPRRWFEGCPAHTHKALDDAIGQGVLFVNIMNERKGKENTTC